jgi:hypothetical protein
MIVFVATVQENSKFIDSIKYFTVLHPFYAFNTEIGKNVLEKLNDTPGKYSSYWENVLRKDIFCIQKSDVVLYDFDNLPEEGRYLSMAASLGKPIIGVSEVLKPASIYFSGSILSIIKPKQVLPMLTFISEHRDFLELPGIIPTGGKQQDETILPDTGMPA